MSILSLEEIEDKIRNCLNTIGSDKCTDRLFVIFVICECLTYIAASKCEVHVANRSALVEVFEFGKSISMYRNTFAHSGSIEELISITDNLMKYSDEICSQFPDNVYTKVYNALS